MFERILCDSRLLISFFFSALLVSTGLAVYYFPVLISFAVPFSVSSDGSSAYGIALPAEAILPNDMPEADPSQCLTGGPSLLDYAGF